MRSSIENIGLSKKFKFRFLNLKKITLFLFLLPSMVWSSILILPFENKSSRNYFWLSESISYALYSILQDEGIDVVSSEKRNSIYEELRISLTTPLTRATSIILANMAGADTIVTGDFIVNDEKVIVSSRIVDLKNGRIGETISVEGSIKELIPLQNFLSWRILEKIKKIDESKRDDFLKRWSNIPLPAWENFIKGLLSKDIQKKEIFLLKSLNLSPDFSECRWELSYHYFKKGDYDKCLNYIKPLLDLKPFSLFIYSLCNLYKKDYDKGIEGFKACFDKGIEKLASANNIGVSYAKKGENEKALEYFRIALLEGSDPDVYFNIAIISNNKNDFLENIKRALEYSQPDFSYFHTLYQRLILWEEIEIAEIVKNISKEYFSSDISVPIIDFMDYLKVIGEKRKEIVRREERDFYKRNAISSLIANDLDSAENSIKKSIHISPFDWEAHLILAKILIRKKDLKNAMKELKFSLWIKDRAENNLEMGKLLIQMGEKEKGIQFLKKAISIDPFLDEAKRVLEKLEK
jgi:tetratricopeptide (TPR) repeat protein